MGHSAVPGEPERQEKPGRCPSLRRSRRADGSLVTQAGRAPAGDFNVGIPASSSHGAPPKDGEPGVQPAASSPSWRQAWDFTLRLCELPRDTTDE